MDLRLWCVECGRSSTLNTRVNACRYLPPLSTCDELRVCAVEEGPDRAGSVHGICASSSAYEWPVVPFMPPQWARGGVAWIPQWEAADSDSQFWSAKVSGAWGVLDPQWAGSDPQTAGVCWLVGWLGVFCQSRRRTGDKQVVSLLWGQEGVKPWALQPLPNLQLLPGFPSTSDGTGSCDHPLGVGEVR